MRETILQSINTPQKHANHPTDASGRGVSPVVKFRFKSRYLELLIAGAFVVLLIYMASFTIRVTRGVSKTIEPPNHTVRLQVLNGCGEPRLAAKVSDQLAHFRDEELGIAIVDTDNFNSLNIDSSFVISREKDLDAARLLAEKLGLSTETVVYRPLDNNYRNVSVTLVLGADYARITLGGPTKQEN